MADPRTYRNVGANTVGADPAAGSSPAQTLNAMSTSAAAGGTPGQRLVDGVEARAEADGLRPVRSRPRRA